MKDIVAYLNVKKLTILNNQLDYAINNPKKRILLDNIRNTSGRCTMKYQTYKDSMNNIKIKLRLLEGNINYKDFFDAYKSFSDKTIIGKPVTCNYCLLSSIYEIALELSYLCYRGKEIGYLPPNTSIIRAMNEAVDYKNKNMTLTTVLPIYKEIKQKIKERMKHIKYEALPQELKPYYSFVKNESKQFGINIRSW